MNTPICDFVKQYSQKNTLRLHMPGHKGQSFLGYESADITEISGADSLYEADGIIRESEENASVIFGCKTLYSTEGSSLLIRSMLYLACLYAKEKGTEPLIFAARNVHKSFLSAAVLLDFGIEWLYPDEQESYLSCNITADKLDKVLKEAETLPTAVYITSPDYLGNIADIRALSDICKKYGVLLLVDNAHGAYLRFLPESQHPVDLGADMCCDSAHKTLPVLTGGAYLHIANNAPECFYNNAKNALSLFGSTSPSYLILQSLDNANIYLHNKFRSELEQFLVQVAELKKIIKNSGYVSVEKEPLKITLNTKKYGYTGKDFAFILSENNIECEFADEDFVVLMLTPCLGVKSLDTIRDILLSVPQKAEITTKPPKIIRPQKVMSVRCAALSPRETLPLSECIGRTLAISETGCPPAVPIVAGGELIDEKSVEVFQYYSINKCTVTK